MPDFPSRRHFLQAAVPLIAAPGALFGGQFKPLNPDQPPPPPGQLPVKPKPQEAPVPGQATGQPTFSTNVKLVQVFASVRDGKGTIVKDLDKADFTLTEDGKPQNIQYFSRESNLPLTLGLLVDTSLSQRNVLGDEKRASYKFFEQVLREDKDQGFVIHFDREVELLADLTSSRKNLDKGLDLLEIGSRGDSGGSGTGGGSGSGSRGGGGWGGGQGGQGGHHRHGGGTTMYDAVLLAGDEILKKQQGRKAIIMLTDGVDNGSKVTINDAIDSAQRADTLIYSILFADKNGYGNSGPSMGMGRRGGMGGGGYPRGGGDRPDGKKVLQRLSKQTGGGFFEVSKKHPIDEIYQQIEDELRSQYSFGYPPDASNTSRDYRHIQLTVSRPGLIVQARDGYYPGS
jgi:VWFA-related protein